MCVRRISFLWSMILLILCTIVTRAQADINGTLIYLREVNGNSEYVGISETQKLIYPILPDTCTGVSPGGIYLIDQSRSKDYLTIRLFHTGEVILHEKWHPEWESCASLWYGKTMFGIRREGTTDDFFHYEFTEGQLKPVTLHNTRSPLFTKELPQDYATFTSDPLENQYRLVSPDQKHVFYRQCVGPVTHNGVKGCTQSPLVIYDSAQGQVISIQNPGLNIIEDRAAVWSATGRYLAYATSDENPFINVYDVKTATYLDTSFKYGYFMIDWDKNLLWSPQQDRLLIWFRSSVGIEPVTDDPGYETPVIYDAIKQSFVIAQSGYYLPSRGDVGVWSPDGNGFAFVDAQFNLVYVDIMTGAGTVIDQNVERIIDWSEE